MFSTFGVPVEISSDGGPEYEAKVFKGFLERWGVRHRESSAYLPTSNGRAEVGVKTNLGPRPTPFILHLVGLGFSPKQREK